MDYTQVHDMVNELGHEISRRFGQFPTPLECACILERIGAISFPEFVVYVNETKTR